MPSGSVKFIGQLITDADIANMRPIKTISDYDGVSLNALLMEHSNMLYISYLTDSYLTQVMHY